MHSQDRECSSTLWCKVRQKCAGAHVFERLIYWKAFLSLSHSYTIKTWPFLLVRDHWKEIITEQMDKIGG